jgi:hypothetical protein
MEQEVRNEALVLSRKRISLAGLTYLCNTVILPRVLYRLKFSHAHASTAQIDRIQRSLLLVAAKKAGLTHSCGAQCIVWWVYGLWMEEMGR